MHDVRRRKKTSDNHIWTKWHKHALTHTHTQTHLHTHIYTHMHVRTVHFLPSFVVLFACVYPRLHGSWVQDVLGSWVVVRGRERALSPCPWHRVQRSVDLDLLAINGSRSSKSNIEDWSACFGCMLPAADAAVAESEVNTVRSGSFYCAVAFHQML